MTDESAGAFSCLNQAKRGPDWQPVTAANTATIVIDRSNVRFMEVNA